MNTYTRNHHDHRCDHIRCDRVFTRNSDLKRHKRCCHPGPNTPRYWCSASDCKRSEHYPYANPFFRKDKCEHHKASCLKIAPASLKEPVGKNIGASLVPRQDQDLQAQFNDGPFYAGFAGSWDNSGVLCNADNIGGHVEEHVEENLGASLVICQDQDWQTHFNNGPSETGGIVL